MAFESIKKQINRGDTQVTVDQVTDVIRSKLGPSGQSVAVPDMRMALAQALKIYHAERTGKHMQALSYFTPKINEKLRMMKNTENALEKINLNEDVHILLQALYEYLVAAKSEHLKAYLSPILERFTGLREEEKQKWRREGLDPILVKTEDMPMQFKADVLTAKENFEESLH